MSLEEKEYIKYGNYDISLDKNTIVVNYNNNNLEYIIDNNNYSYKQFSKIKFSNKYKLFFKFDFSKRHLELSEADYIIKTIIKIGKIVKKNKVNIGIIEDSKTILANIIRGKSDYELNIITAIGMLLCNDNKQKCEFVYDETCDYLDEIVIKRNVCGFKDDKCIAKRNSTCITGCCNHFKNKSIGILYQSKLYPCEYLVDKRCTTKCLTCKMHMCDYIIKKTGIKFTSQNILPLKYYFNPIQKYILKMEYFTPREKTLKKLIFFGF
ncbi:MAG: hypothetical protein PHU94_04375 [Bacilli bacterium]|nr:hypothetical protein [Bacilli bacterium]